MDAMHCVVDSLSTMHLKHKSINYECHFHTIYHIPYTIYQNSPTVQKYHGNAQKIKKITFWHKEAALSMILLASAAVLVYGIWYENGTHSLLTYVSNASCSDCLQKS